jgi:hypothetical protein
MFLENSPHTGGAGVVAVSDFMIGIARGNCL